MEAYNVLENLSHISYITDEDIDTFLLMTNDTTHENMILQEPDYVPSFKVDNTEYEKDVPERILNGRVLKLGSIRQMEHYHINMAAMLKLGEWFDYLREEGVYDNTRIILVSDHGYDLYSLDELVADEDTCFSFYFPLLMVKDFGSKEFVVSDEFMTNADVPSIALDGVIEQPMNPFTGKLINSDEKNSA